MYLVFSHSLKIELKLMSLMFSVLSRSLFDFWDRPPVRYGMVGVFPKKVIKKTAKTKCFIKNLNKFRKNFKYGSCPKTNQYLHEMSVILQEKSKSLCFLPAWAIHGILTKKLTAAPWSLEVGFGKWILL